MTNLIDEISSLVYSKTNFKKSVFNKIKFNHFNQKTSFKTSEVKT